MFTLKNSGAYWSRALCLGLLTLLAGLQTSYATHNAAGEIVYRQLNQFTYEIVLITFTEYCHDNADRPSATIEFSDGTSQEVQRERIDTLNECYKKSTYRTTHTFPGYANYLISYEDPFRNFNVVNMTNSGGTSFYVETHLVINPFVGPNNSPVLLEDPIDFGNIGKVFYHNPNAWDQDGDSLSYTLVVPKQSPGMNVFGYSQPQASSSFGVHPTTGEVVWDAPVKKGLYNIAIRIDEWRKGPNGRYIKIGYLVRDMQIVIEDGGNQPPDIRDMADTCVTAGITLQKLVRAYDPDSGDKITLTATGGPFEVGGSPATFPQPTVGEDSVQQTFSWNTVCAHVRKEPYQVVFKAKDDHSKEPNEHKKVPLIDLETWLIRVIGPAPTGLTGTPIGNSIRLDWDLYSCTKAVGFKIYRRPGPYALPPDPCGSGLPIGSGYKLVGMVSGVDQRSFLDDNDGQGLTRGINYCYRITAVYPDEAESYASNETCVSLSKDVPIMTMADVNATHSANGEVLLEWSKPSQLDTTQFNPPFEFRLLTKTSVAGAFTELARFTRPFYAQLNDTVYTHTGINTRDLYHSYKVELRAQGSSGMDLVGTSNAASSLFLNILPLDNKLELNLTELVPWRNDSFFVYRGPSLSGPFSRIASALIPQYTDTGLRNGDTYCYYIQSKGGYGTDGLREPLLNRSQIACGTPVDTTPPCAPDLVLFSDCKAGFNQLQWYIQDTECRKDVVGFEVWFTPRQGGEFTQIAFLDQDTARNFVHGSRSSVAGCYFILAVDSVGNKGPATQVVCAENCPVYILPNVFTPNGDGINDNFIPYPDSIRQVTRIQIDIFNRWGTVVYSYNGADFSWNGITRKGEPAPEGVYFYTGKVFEARLQGETPRDLHGFFHLIK